MTPGISVNKMIASVNDQQYRTPEEVDTDFVIVGRALYNSTNLTKDISKLVPGME